MFFFVFFPFIFHFCADGGTMKPASWIYPREKLIVLKKGELGKKATATQKNSFIHK